ncbi:MAG: MutS-related protein, partial [Thiothrix sp.]
VHIDAAEHGDNIVFLHAVKDGPANQSYGLQVAQLAGVPRTVIAQARKKLRSLEQHSRAQPQVGQTLPLVFTAPEAKDATAERLKAALQALDPDDLTPRQALETLFRLKQLLAD